MPANHPEAAVDALPWLSLLAFVVGMVLLWRRRTRLSVPDALARSVIRQADARAAAEEEAAAATLRTARQSLEAEAVPTAQAAAVVARTDAAVVAENLDGDLDAQAKVVGELIGAGRPTSDLNGLARKAPKP